METTDTARLDAAPKTSKAAFWIGWILCILPALLFLFSAATKLLNAPGLEEGMTHLGWPMRYALALGIVEAACAIIYLIPRTAVIGAILLTGYIGGAMATHARLGEPVFMHILIGLVLWLGLFLRDRRLRELIPLRKPVAP